MAPLKALLLTDGVPGHYHLAEGILAAVARRRPVETVRIETRRRRLAPGRILAALVNRGLPASLVLEIGYGLKLKTLARADLIVSAGGNTLAANVAAARILGAANVFYGSLRRFRPADFALVLTSHESRARLPRHIMTLKPSAFDPDTLSPRPYGADVNSRTSIAGLLVGGNTATIRYTSEDWTRLFEFMHALNARAGTRWIVSNSRRTPPEASERLTRIAADPTGPILRFIDVARAGSETLGELFARSSAILATVDSSSMVSEAVWVRRPLLAVAPAECQIPEWELDYRHYLEENGWARSLPIAELTADRALAALSEIRPLAANPLDTLAATLAERLPHIFREGVR